MIKNLLVLLLAASLSALPARAQCSLEGPARGNQAGKHHRGEDECNRSGAESESGCESEQADL